MTIIKKEQQYKVLNEFWRRRGVIHKLMFDGINMPIGYLVRTEFEKSENDEIDVGVSIDFNFYNHFDIDKISNDSCIQSKFFMPNDLKFFSLISNLKMNLKKFTRENPAYIIQYNGEMDDKKFEIGVTGIVNTIINELIHDVKSLKGGLYYSDHYGNRILNDYLQGNYTKLSEYIIDKILRIPKYYKNKKICLYF